MTIVQSPETNKNSRVRASKNAIKAAIDALHESGLSVDKMFIEGGKVVISPHPVDAAQIKQSHKGPKQW